MAGTDDFGYDELPPSINSYPADDNPGVGTVSLPTSVSGGTSFDWNKSLSSAFDFLLRRDQVQSATDLAKQQNQLASRYNASPFGFPSTSGGVVPAGNMAPLFNLLIIGGIIFAVVKMASK